ncbi:MAG: SUF system NifU family Fe-S cluster assembly protein [Chloroflexi bacterium]|nr:SUF system NifU family Fe-S cluster assembly protein [Chloroflexota bacterium]
MTTPYREHVLDHYRNPRNRGTLDYPDVVQELDNPVCGDTVRIELRLEGDRVIDARFTGRGCVISIAAASMLTEAIKGKALKELREMTDDDALALLGVPLGAVRVKCGLLPLRTLQKGLEQIKTHDTRRLE